jgi:DNA repair exonuclease SbcCD ATPase subunit
MNPNQQESSREKIIALTSSLNTHLKRMEELYEDRLPFKISDLVSIEDPEQLIRRPEELADFLHYFKILTTLSDSINSETKEAQTEFESSREMICKIADDLEAQLKGYADLLNQSKNVIATLSDSNKTLKSEMEKCTTWMSTFIEQESARKRNQEILEAQIDKSRRDIESLTDKFMNEMEKRETAFRIELEAQSQINRELQAQNQHFTRELEAQAREIEAQARELQAQNQIIRELQAQNQHFTRELDAQNRKFARQLEMKTVKIAKLNRVIDVERSKHSILESKLSARDDKCRSLKKELKSQRCHNRLLSSEVISCKKSLNRKTCEYDEYIWGLENKIFIRDSLAHLIEYFTLKFTSLHQVRVEPTRYFDVLKQYFNLNPYLRDAFNYYLNNLDLRLVEFDGLISSKRKLNRFFHRKVNIAAIRDMQISRVGMNKAEIRSLLKFVDVYLVLERA